MLAPIDCAVGQVMREYEIRVIGEFGSDIAIYETFLSSVALAIGEGRRIAAGNPFEVWLGMDCIFTTQPNPSWSSRITISSDLGLAKSDASTQGIVTCGSR